MTKGKNANRQHKATLFTVIFNDKKELLSLYNAVNHTAYDNPDDLIITTLEDIIYMGMKNDLSFLIGHTLNLYEHQSTWNPNMPLRGLLYFSELYQGYIEENELADLLKKNRAEVCNMVLREYDEAAHINNEKQISFEKGEKAKEEKILKVVIQKAIAAENTKESILKELVDDYDTSPEDAEEYYKKVTNNAKTE